MLDRRMFVAALAASVAAPAAAQTGNLPVVATFSILGDMVRAVGGDRIALGLLVGPDADAHVFRPTPADSRKLVEARVIVSNGLGYEGFLDRLVRSSGTKARMIRASDGIDRLAAPKGQAHGHGHSHGHSHGDFDPHAWQSVAAARRYVANIRDGLATADPDGREAYARNATAYLAELDRLEAEIRAMLAPVPEARRRVVTGHDAFRYFGRDFGLTFLALQGASTEQEISARDMTRLIRLIRQEKVAAVFLENLTNSRLIEQVARETGAKVGGTLYSDALTGPAGPAPTYLALMRHNAGVFAKALSASA
jgi:zinc/manganese transport system substrate-binding protein